MPAFKDLTGQKFERLLVQKKSKSRAGDGSILWDCICECGVKRTINTRSLKNGNTRSCGCLRTELRTGSNNPSAKKNINKCNGRYISSENIWYRCAERIKFCANKKGIKFGFDSAAEFALYLKDIAPIRCPVFGMRLESGQGKLHNASPTIDKIIPSMGYVPGNVQILSHLANRMKNDATKKQLKQFACWVLNQEVVK